MNMKLDLTTGGVGLGVLLVWIGAMVGIFTTGSVASKVLMGLVETGTALLAGCLIAGGITESERGRGSRIAMIVMGAIIFLIQVYLAFVFGAFLPASMGMTSF